MGSDRSRDTGIYRIVGDERARFGGWLLAFWAFICLQAAWHFSTLISDGTELELMFESPQNAAVS